MEAKHLKDFVIAMVVLLAFALGIKLYTLNQKINNIPDNSIHQKIALSEDLLSKIQEIEESIQDRKDFQFTVTKDPLEQNLIVKTQRDLEKQWREEVESMVRLESTIVPQKGEKMASIAYQGKSRIYRVGDTFIKGKIEDIHLGEIIYSYQGLTKTLSVQKIPPKPKEITQQTTANKERAINW